MFYSNLLSQCAWINQYLTVVRKKKVNLIQKYIDSKTELIDPRGCWIGGQLSEQSNKAPITPWITWRQKQESQVVKENAEQKIKKSKKNLLHLGLKIIHNKQRGMKFVSFFQDCKEKRNSNWIFQNNIHHCWNDRQLPNY